MHWDGIFFSPLLPHHKGLLTLPRGYCFQAMQRQCPRGAGLEPGVIHTHIPRQWETEVSTPPLFARLTVYFPRRTMSSYQSVAVQEDSQMASAVTHSKRGICKAQKFPACFSSEVFCGICFLPLRDSHCMSNTVCPLYGFICHSFLLPSCQGNYRLLEVDLLLWIKHRKSLFQKYVTS